MRWPVLVVTVALAGACSGGSTATTQQPSATSPATTAAPTPSPTASDPYTQLTPPDSPGIGDFSGATANHAYAVSQGLLAEALLEHDTLLGANAAQLATDLAGSAKSPSVAKAVRSATAAGLILRPRFPASVTVPAKGFVQVTASDWGGTTVGTPDGSTAIRINWTGSLTYSVRYRGKPVSVTYAQTISWVYQALTNEPNGVQLLTAVPGTSRITPQLPACNAKGVIIPVTGAGACPV